jgi:hypothetical protein
VAKKNVPTEKPSENKEGKESKVRFEMCTCNSKKLGPHGYFYDSKAGKCPFPNASIESAEKNLTYLTEERGLTPEEVEAVRAQIKAAGLPEKMSDDERDMFASLTAMQEQLADLLNGLDGVTVIQI